MPTLRVLPFLFLLSTCASAATTRAYVLECCAFPSAISGYDAAKGEFGRLIRASVEGLLIAPTIDGQEIWALSRERVHAIIVYSAESGAQTATIEFSEPPTGIVFTADGKHAYVVAASANGSDSANLYKLSVADHSMISKMPFTANVGAFASSMLLSEDGSTIYFANLYTPAVLIFDASSLTLINTIPFPNGTYSPALALTGNELILSNGAQIFFIDRKTYQITNTITLPLQAVTDLTVSSEGSLIYVLGFVEVNLHTINSFIYALYAQSGATRNSQEYAGFNLARLAVSPDGSQIVAAGNLVASIDPSSLAIVGDAAPISPVLWVTYSNSGVPYLLYIASSPVAEIDTATEHTTGGITTGNSYAIATDNSSTHLFTAGPYNLSEIEASANRVVRNVLMNDDGHGIYSLAAGRGHVYGSGGILHDFDLTSGTDTLLAEPKLVDTDPGYIITIINDQLAVSPDRSALYLTFNYSLDYCCDQSPVKDSGVKGNVGLAIYDLSTKTILSQISAVSASPIVFNPDGKTAYVGGSTTGQVGGSAVIYLVDTATRAIRETWQYPAVQFFHYLAISPDGSTLYGLDGPTIHVLNTSTGVDSRQFPLPAGTTGKTLAITPDATQIYVGVFTMPSVLILNLLSGSFDTISTAYAAQQIAIASF